MDRKTRVDKIKSVTSEKIWKSHVWHIQFRKTW